MTLRVCVAWPWDALQNKRSFRRRFRSIVQFADKLACAWAVRHFPNLAEGPSQGYFLHAGSPMGYYLAWSRLARLEDIA